MNTETIVSILCLALLTGSGCVMNSTYNAAVLEGEAIKGELERTKEEQQALIRQVTELEKLNRATMQETESTMAAARQADSDAANELREAEAHQAKLKQRIPQLIRQHEVLQGDLAVAKENSAALQELVDVYQKKLAEVPKDIVASSSLAIEPISKPFDPATLPLTQSLPVPVPAPAMEPVKPAEPPMPEKAAAPAKSNPETADTGWLSYIKQLLLAIWQSIF